MGAKMIRMSGSAEGLISMLTAQKKTFKVQRTSGSTKVNVLDSYGLLNIAYYFNDEHIQMNYLHLITKVREEFKRNEAEIKKHKEVPSVLDIKYYSFSEQTRITQSAGEIHEFKNIIEADITKAYYQAARNLKFISPEFYELCLNLPKEQRLKLLGSIAVRKYINSYENGVHKEQEIKADEIMRKAWFLICDNVAACMTEIQNKLKNDFLFYWVDGIYFVDKAKNKKVIEQIGKKYAFAFKYVKIDGMTSTNKSSHIEIQLKKGDEVKLFYPPKKKIIKYF